MACIYLVLLPTDGLYILLLLLLLPTDVLYIRTAVFAVTDGWPVYTVVIVTDGRPIYTLLL